MSDAKLLQALDSRPVAGVPLTNVSLLRLDQYDALAPGNKWFKLQGYLSSARAHGVSRLVSFGGAWSNHLHALAALGKQEGMTTVGIVRGDDPVALSPTLVDCQNWGMELVFVSRGEYRRRDDPGYLATLQSKYADSLLIPEGGSSGPGVAGCVSLGRMMADLQSRPGKVMIAAGTGTTLAGVAIGLGEGWQLVGVSALKGAHDMQGRIEAGIQQAAPSSPVASWQVLHDHHCGGFARVSPELQAFMLEFEAVYGVLLDPIYTAKVLFALHQLRASGAWPVEEAVTVVHTGGLQGRRGFNWLS
ncbi:MAG: pyridoxal-phosphate dependent enzyme [Halieaceae bacterium]